MTDQGRIAAVREFNRFWTKRIGLLRRGLLDTRFSLTEARVIFELAQAPSTELADLRSRLDLDAGYLSRVVGRLKDQELVETERSPSDGRRRVLRLTTSGREAFADLDRRSATEIGDMLATLTEEDQGRLIGAMGTIRDLIEPPGEPRPYVIRPLRPGDLGWVVHRHGVLYNQEYGWDQTFEALVARIVADYVDDHDPRRHDAWIAELDGEPVGCVFCVDRDEETAQLRILLVEPKARGLGIGSRLVGECLEFARRAGYRRMVLWTNDVLVSARRIYEAYGFRLVEEESHHSFGHDLVGQYWSLDLDRASRP